MSRFEELMEVKSELREARETIARLEAEEPTAQNLAKVEELRDRAKHLKIFIRSFAAQYGMKA